MSEPLIVDREGLQAALRGQKRAKYGNARCEVHTPSHASLRECRRFLELEQMQRAGLIRGLRQQVTWELAPGRRGRKMVIDFEYLDADGRVVLEDAKGYATRDWLTKRAWLLEKYSLEVRLV